MYCLICFVLLVGPVCSLMELGGCIKPDIGSDVSDSLCSVWKEWYLVELVFVSDGLYLKGFMTMLSCKR